jgi:hypothetical protein
MALPTNTFTAFAAIGQREDLGDDIYNIAPSDTPIMQAIGRAKATAVLHEWQTDTLASVDADNAVLEGDDATTDAATATVRLTNRCQISDKVARTTGTLEAVTKAGRSDELDYQVMKKTKELKRDMETNIAANQIRVVGNSTLARRAAGMLAWISTNTSAGASGTDPSPIDGTDARNDGTQRAFTEAMLKDVLAQCWSEGGDPTHIYVGAYNKQAFSGFTGRGTVMEEADEKTINAAVEIYVSDFGKLKVFPSRFSRTRDCLVLDPKMWAVAYLRPMHSIQLAKTGDSDRKQLLVEWTLEARNEKASGLVADLTTS